MGKSKIEKGHQVNVRLSEYQYKQLVECCDILEINQSDFIRNAISNQVNLTYTQEMLSSLYKQFKKIDLSKATEKDLGEIQAYMDMFQSVVNIGKDGKGDN